MYCTCSSKKKIVTHIDSQRVEVCSKRLGGCGKEIGQYSVGIDYAKGYGTINLNRSMVGKRFKTRSGDIVKLINVTEDPDLYPFIFEMEFNLSSGVITTTSDGKYSLSGEHKYDITEIL